MSKKYNLAIGAIFKNESHILKEWIEHYLFHGVEHFYLINDESTDDFMPILEPYMKENKVTLFNPKWQRYFNRQRDMYTEILLSHKDNIHWLIIADLDEFLWSPRNIDLRLVLKECAHLTEIQITMSQFGSNGLIEQPASVVQAFTKKRASDVGTADSYGYKYIVNLNHSWKELNVHYAIPSEETFALKKWLILPPEWFRLNHYNCQSQEYWNKIKCTRGDVNEYKKLDESKFALYDTNDIEDTGLAEQNRSKLS